MAYSPRGSLYHKRVCLLYSIFKEQLAKAWEGSHVEKAGQGRKEGAFTNRTLPPALFFRRYRTDREAQHHFDQGFPDTSFQFHIYGDIDVAVFIIEGTQAAL